MVVSEKSCVVPLEKVFLDALDEILLDLKMRPKVCFWNVVLCKQC